jgi:ParB-like chromosome segregation protein Spo0J
MQQSRAGVLAGTGELGESLSALRLTEPGAELLIERSLLREGQVTPVVCYRAGERVEVIDGFKRLRVVRRLGWPELWADIVEVDSATAKVLVVKANGGTALTDLEQAWVVRALYRQDKLTQGEIGRLLGRDKSWVSRRLMLAEGLSSGVEAGVRLGLITASAAREIGRLPRGNQDGAAEVISRRGLTSRQACRLVSELLAAPDAQSRERILEAATSGTAFVREAASKRGLPRTAGEWLMSEVSGLKRLSVRLTTRLLGSPLSSLGDECAEVATRELKELGSCLSSLCQTIERVTCPRRAP